MFSEGTLVKLLPSAGFRNVEVKSYRKGKCPDLEILDNRPEHTLFVEGIKNVTINRIDLLLKKTINV
jgi:hypothetical protein